MTTLDDLITGHARTRGDRTAILYGDRSISYKELDERANRVAQALLADGVGRGDRVAILDKNGPEFFELFLGAARIGAVTVGVNWRLAPPEIAFIIKDATTKVLIAGEEFIPQLDKVADQLGAIARTVVVGSDPRYTDWESWLAAQDPVRPDHTVAREDVVIQMYTSGTTGLPKGAMLTNDNMMAEIPLLGSVCSFTADGVTIVVMPLFHIAGSAWGLVGLAQGCINVLHREVNPTAILESLEKEKVTYALFVPAVIQLLLATPGVDTTDFSALEVVVYGASPISQATLVRAMEAFGCGFVQAYGLTETTGGVVLLAPEDHQVDGPNAGRLRAAGKPVPDVELRIVDPSTGGAAATGDVGEIWIRGPFVMKGYWNRPDDTAQAIDVDGWFHSGDAGYLDADGYLYIHDRIKDMIISGGENIYPAEVENVLMSHPDVADVAVIGVPDEKWGETVKAVIVKAAGADPSATDLLAWSRERLAGFKCPTSIDWLDALPRNPSGKILKKDLRQPYWVGHDRQVN